MKSIEPRGVFTFRTDGGIEIILMNCYTVIEDGTPRITGISTLLFIFFSLTKMDGVPMDLSSLRFCSLEMKRASSARDTMKHELVAGKLVFKTKLGK